MDWSFLAKSSITSSLVFINFVQFNYNILLLILLIACDFQQSKDNIMVDSQANTINVSKNPFNKMFEKFNWVGFKRWKQKMSFYLTTMNLANIVKEEVLEVDKDPSSKSRLWLLMHGSNLNSFA